MQTENWAARVDALARYYGGNAKLAVKLKVGFATVSRWRNGRTTPQSELAIKAVERLERAMLREKDGAP